MDERINKIFNKIFELLYKPIVTPYNLLENAKLENYSYVKYYKGENGLIAELKCLVDGVDTVFKYEFDNKDYLQRIILSNKNEIVFNRERDLEFVKLELFEFID